MFEDIKSDIKMDFRSVLEDELMNQHINRKKLLTIVPELKVMLNCEQNHPAHKFDVFEHTLEVVKRVPNEKVLKLAALLHDIGKPYKKVQGEDGIDHFWGHEEVSALMAKNIMKKLGYSDYIIELVTRLILFHDTKINPEASEVRSAVEKIGKDIFGKLLKLQEADLLAHSEQYIAKKLPVLNEIKKIYETMT